MRDIDALPRRRRRLPIAFRLSFILMLAAVLPLLLTVGISEYMATRPSLISQANQAMHTDAKTRVQLIDTYLNERLLDAETLSQVATVQSFLALPAQERATNQDAIAHASYSLVAGQFRDKRYVVWSLFDAQGQLSLYYPLTTNKQEEAVVPPGKLQEMKDSKTGLAVYSPVYYDAATKKAFMHIYSPIFAGGKPGGVFLGFLRARLNLDYIWDIVKDDRGIGNSGSSFILDEHGIRIAESTQTDLFTAVAPLPVELTQQIAQENWYGPDSTVQVQNDPALTSIIRSAKLPDDFTLTPHGKTEEFQAAPAQVTTVPWKYFVISPSSVVTQSADQQLWATLAAAGGAALLAVLIGLVVSNRISRPIMRSVDQLHENSEALNGLAKKQQSASSEQLWVVDAIQVGLQSVQYYTDATRIAAHKLGEIGNELEYNWRRQNMEGIKQGLQQILNAAHYIEKATNYQGDSGQKLSTAIKVTTQVNEQLADGAISATEAASQLEQVVNDLRNVVGQ